MRGFENPKFIKDKLFTEEIKPQPNDKVISSFEELSSESTQLAQEEIIID
jgi:hypothetical protein